MRKLITRKSEDTSPYRHLYGIDHALVFVDLSYPWSGLVKLLQYVTAGLIWTHAAYVLVVSGEFSRA